MNNLQAYIYLMIPQYIHVASKLYGVDATIIIFVFVLYCIVLYCIVLYCIVFMKIIHFLIHSLETYSFVH